MEDARAGRVDVADLTLAGEPGQAQALGDLVVADEPVAVPQCLAVAEPDAEDPARPDEPVVGSRVLRVERVGIRADPQEPAVQVLRDLPVTFRS